MGMENYWSIVVTGLVPVIHVVELPETLRLAGIGAAWMAGTSPAMTERAVRRPSASNRVI